MVATTTMRARFPLLLLLLGILFLASVSFTYGALAEQGEEKESRCRDDEKCRQEEWREGRRHQDPEERERVREREEERERSQERQKEEKRRPEEKEEQQQERGQGGGQSRKSRNNPFYFPSQMFQTRYGNEHGRVRVLQRFDHGSKKLENLQNYRIVEFEARPNTLVLPHHSDADYFLVVQEGEATVHLVNPNDRESYNLERGDALRIPSGTTFYIVNRHDIQNLRIAKLAIPVNKPGKFDDFFPASNEDQQKKQSYLRGFSRNTLQAAFNAPFEYIQRILLEENEGEQQQQQQQQQHGSQEEGVIVKLSKEQIQELTSDAKSSSRWGGSAESGPFNLRSRPIFSNQFGKFFEVTPERSPQLQDFDIFLSCVEIKQGALMLPHFNSKAIVVLVVNQGTGDLELVALRDEQQQEQGQQEQQEEEEEEEEGTRQVRSYTVRLSRGDVVVIPAAYPVAINASSDLHLFGFGINAEDNRRNFLAGESDNVLNQMHRQVKELAFPGSGEEVERLLRNQRESYFVSSASSAMPGERSEEGRQGRRDPLFSILGAFN